MIYMKTIVMTSDKSNWLLKGFYRQWEFYCPEIKPIACGYTRPEGFSGEFYSLGPQENFPINKWSDSLLRVLDEVVGDELVMILLEDYWLTRRVNYQKIIMARDIMLEHPDAIRFDLTTDRQYSSRYEYYGSSYDTDIILALPCEYYLSFQAAIWNPTLLATVLQPNETPWQAEILGSDRLSATNYKVFGTMQWLVRYQIMVNKGQFSLNGNWMYPPRQITMTDARILANLGYMPEEALADGDNINNQIM